MFLFNAWPILFVIGLLLILVWKFQSYWLPYVTAMISAKKIKAYTPDNALDALHFYLYHLQKIAQQKTPKRQPSAAIDTWLLALEEAYGDLPAIRTLADQVHSTFYLGEYSELAQIQQAALSALHELQG